MPEPHTCDCAQALQRRNGGLPSAFVGPRVAMTCRALIAPSSGPGSFLDPQQRWRLHSLLARCLQADDMREQQLNSAEAVQKLAEALTEFATHARKRWAKARPRGGLKFTLLDEPRSIGSKSQE
jgi:hypothetical protein